MLRTNTWLLTLIAKLVLWGESILFERDVKVWNSKTYVDRPIFGIEDKMLQKHRRWYSQFYSSDNKSPIGNLEWWLLKYTKSSFYAFCKTLVFRLFNFQNHNLLKNGSNNLQTCPPQSGLFISMNSTDWGGQVCRYLV